MAFKFKSKKNEDNRTHEATEQERSLILNPDTDFDTVETYKAIRTNIMFSMPKTDKGKIVAVTSAAPNEGKSTTTVNLALTFAQMGAKVILVDGDLRKSRVHRYINVPRGDGVTNVLCGFSTLEDTIRHNVRDGLDILTAGAVPPNPAELLASEEYERMIARLREMYDYVFIDTSPIPVVTDASFIVRSSDGAVIIVRQDITTYDQFETALEYTKQTGTKVLGVILLGVREKNRKYYYSKHGKYASRYGYADAPKKAAMEAEERKKNEKKDEAKN